MVTVTLNENGQVTIPAKILKEGGLTKGTRIAVMEIGKRIMLVPLPKDTLQALIGLGEKLPPSRRWRQKRTASEDNYDGCPRLDSGLGHLL